MTVTDEKGRLGEEDCKRFRSQYDPSLYSSMWSGKWGSIPPIKEEKSQSQSHSQSPTHSESQYGGHFPSGGGGGTFTGTNSSQASSELLYETMSQVYPALSSSLGTVCQHRVSSLYCLFFSVSSSGSNNNSGSDFYPSNAYTQYTGGAPYNSTSTSGYSGYTNHSGAAGGVVSSK